MANLFNIAKGNYKKEENEPSLTNQLVINVKKTHPDAVIPEYAHGDDFCVDLTAVDVHYDSEIDCFVYHTGIAIELPFSHGGLVPLRSSNRKTECYMPNGIGVIDAGYRGEIFVSVKNRTRGDMTQPFNVGDRIAQLVVIPAPRIKFNEVEELSETERGEGGHGSTGK